MQPRRAGVLDLYGSIVKGLWQAARAWQGRLAIVVEVALILTLVIGRTLDTSRPFLMAWTTVLGLLAVASPRSALVVLVAFAPFSEWMGVDGVGMKVVIIALIGIGFVLRLAFTRRWPPLILPVKFAAVLLAATAISVLYTAIRMPELAVPAVVAWLAGIGGGLIVLCVAWAAAASGNIRPAVAAVVALVVAAGASLLDFLAAGAVRESVFGWLLRPDRLALPRVTGIIPAPNAVATVLLCALAVMVAILVLGRGRRRLVLMVPVVLVAVTIVLTYSRTGLLGMFVIAVLVIAYRRPRAAVAVLVAGLALSVVAIPAYMRFRAGALGSGDVSDLAALLTGDVKRLEGWAAALRMWSDQPLTGFGFLSFKALALHYGSAYVTAPHNELLRLLAEGGIGVAVAFVAFVVATVRTLWRSASPFALGAVGALVGLLLGGTFNNPFLYVQVTAPAFAIVGVALGRPEAFGGGSPRPRAAERVSTEAPPSSVEDGPGDARPSPS
jgi:O-antigen ligase